MGLGCLCRAAAQVRRSLPGLSRHALGLCFWPVPCWGPLNWLSPLCSQPGLVLLEPPVSPAVAGEPAQTETGQPRSEGRWRRRMAEGRPRQAGARSGEPSEHCRHCNRRGAGRESERARAADPVLPGDRWERERGASEGFQRWAGFLSRRQTREGGGSPPAPYLQFQSAVLTAAATLGRGRGGRACGAEPSQPAHRPVLPALSGGAVSAVGAGTPAGSSHRLVLG